MRDRPDPPLATLIPQHLRNRDAEQGRALEALLGLLGEELGIVERDIDQLYDNWFIETCEPWVIPYIGALIGARPMRDFGNGEAGPRSYVANTLGYRQAKGTAAALEQIARDVTGWPVVAVEFFQKLIWSQNVNHVRPDSLGTASIRDADNARRAHGPFESAGHSAAAGAADGFSGRYNIPHLGLFVWRLDAFPLGFLSNEAAGFVGGLQARASAIGPQFRHFDPLGADRALFNRPKTDRTIAGRVDERLVPAALDRRLLHLDLNAVRAGVPGAGRWFDDLPVIRIRLDGAEVPAGRLRSCNLETRDDGAGNPTWRRPDLAGEILFDPELGRIALHADDENKTLETACAFAAPFAMGGGPYDRTTSFAAWRGSLFIVGAADPWSIGVSARVEDQSNDPDQGGVVVATLAAAIEAWNQHATPGARGIIVLLDNASYTDDLTTVARVIDIPTTARLAIVAAAWPRHDEAGGVVRRDLKALAPIYRRPHIRSDIHVRGRAGAPNDEPGLLVLDGLLIEGEITVRDGALGTLAIRHASIGATANGLVRGINVMADNGDLAVTLDHVITGPVTLGSAGGGVTIADSIIGEDRSAGEDPDTMALVIDGPEADLDIARSTVFGRTEIRSLEAENCLLIGRTRAAQRQHGCVRFSYTPRSSRVPRRYRCQPDLAIETETLRLGHAPDAAEADRLARGAMPIFTASAYPANAFGQLALSCPAAILSGAFGGAEMGVGFEAGEPFRRANLRDAVDEFLPFGLVAAPLYMT